MKESPTPKRDVYAIVTDKIIEQLEKGKIPWKQPWINSGAPQNLISRKYYRGINIILLASLGYAQNYFITEKQLKEIGGSPRENEKPHLVVFWNWLEKDETKEEQKKTPLLRYYQVYNVSQCIGIPSERIPEINHAQDPLGLADSIVEMMPMCPEIIHVHDKAYYDPSEDVINTPEIKLFVNRERYYSVLFHELIHSTGHSMRLSRKGITERIVFGSPLYSQEELIAEIGSCFLNSIAGIETEPSKNNVAYIQNWLKVLKNDRKFIVFASSYAQKAVDYILNITIDTTESMAQLDEAMPIIREDVPEVETKEKKKTSHKKSVS